MSKKWYKANYRCKNLECGEIDIKEINADYGELFYYSRDYSDYLKEFEAIIRASDINEAEDIAIKFINAIKDMKLDELINLIVEHIDNNEPSINIHISPVETKITVNY